MTAKEALERARRAITQIDSRPYDPLQEQPIVARALIDARIEGLLWAKPLCMAGEDKNEVRREITRLRAEREKL